MKQPIEKRTVDPGATDTTPRIYVASLADYNAGRLVGRWVDANQSVECIREQISEMLRESAEPIAEEWAIHDYEHFGELRLSEFEDLERVSELARLMDEYGPVFAGLANHFGGTSNIAEARRLMEEGYRGAFDSVADYAEESVTDCYADVLNKLPGFIRYHIDFEGIAEDFEMGGDIFTISCGGKIHVFDGHI